MNYTCKICNEIFESDTTTNSGQRGAITQKFKKHLKNIHNITLQEYIIKFYFNNQHPKCNCGCGELLKFREKNAL